MDTPTPRELAASLLPATYLCLQDLRAHGLSRRAITLLVAGGQLRRLRRGRYAAADAHPALLGAGTLGARLDCVSLLAAIGVFVHDHHDLHVQIERGSSRLPARAPQIVAHWRHSSRPRAALASDVVEALIQAVQCQRPREAIATLDSAWHHGVVDEADISKIFADLPRRYRRLRALLDRRSESGPETIMRLLLRGLGHHVEVQVDIAGVGRVDLLVDGWLIVECDSRAHHGGWEAQRRDRRRDLAAARLGYTTVRPLAEDILFHREQTRASMCDVLAHRDRAAVLRKSSTRASARTVSA